MAVTLTNRTINRNNINESSVWYCHDLILAVHKDGSITPNNVLLGNKGDLNITRLTFDVAELEESHIINPMSDYLATLIIYNPNEERGPYNPKVYAVDLDKWVVPSDIFETVIKYQCLLTLTERHSGHTVDDENEFWVSQEFTITINDSLWDARIEYAINNPVDISSDNYGYLMKPPILLTPDNEHYSINTNNTDLGMKKDVFVKRLEFTDSGLDEGFIHKFGVFITNTNVYAVMFKKFDEFTPNKYACLVPKEVTSINGEVDFLVVATNDFETESDNFKRWVGNTIKFKVADNFLDTVIPDQDSNFVLYDGSVLQTADGYIFTVKED